MPEEPDFTPEQSAVVERESDARVIVDAPAGTGKTHVLAGRLAVLVDRDGLEPGDEVLVLSFSRAAVLELRRRVASLAGDAAYATSSTFDSFASRVLSAEVPTDDWLALDFDGRIRAATDLIDSVELPRSLQLVRHLLVDEVQDLVGERAQLVLALIKRMTCGFTVFGDPAQAIYSFQDAGRATSSGADFYSKVVQVSARAVVRESLSKDFRSRVREREAIKAIGGLLRQRHPENAAAQDRIRSLELRLPEVSLATARRLLTRGDGSTSAILCRTNGEVLRVSGDLQELGIPHAIQRPGEDRIVGAWLARIALGVTGLTTSRSALRVSWGGDEASLDDALRLLRRMDPARGESFDLRRVANRIRTGDIPEELNEVPASSVLVSTIHRAKGLEFDRVILTGSDWHPDEDVGEWSRLRYVALTCARFELYGLPATDVSGLSRDKSSGRWVRRGFGKSRWRVHELEVVGSDAESARPAGAGSQEADVPELQRYLLEGVSPGDPVDLRLDATRSHGRGYRILHSGKVVGNTNERFGELIARASGGRMPDALSGVRVETVDTVAGDAIAARNCGLGAHGLWARVRVFGFGVLEFGTNGHGGI